MSTNTTSAPLFMTVGSLAHLRGDVKRAAVDYLAAQDIATLRAGTRVFGDGAGHGRFAIWEDYSEGGHGFWLQVADVTAARVHYRRETAVRRLPD